MLKRESLYAFLESSFDYLLAIDAKERVLHINKPLRRDCFPDTPDPTGAALGDLLAPSSLETFRSAMAQAHAGLRGIAVLTRSGDGGGSVPLKAGFAGAARGELYIFFGNKVEGIEHLAADEKTERSKELACLYEVADFIEYSRSINEFFTGLPKYLAQGMLFPEEAVVYSVYQKIEYGQKPSSSNFISAKLVVGKQEKGEIVVGYLDDAREILPEEQRMLNEIGRMLNLALERKELRERLAQKHAEEEEYNRRLEELQREIAAREAELDDQGRKLDIVNSSLNRVKSGWEESKIQLQTMFKAIPDEVVLIDKKRTIVMANREEYKPGNYCYSECFERDRPCEDCRLARILHEKTPLTLTMKKDDRYLQVHALPVYSKDNEVDGILEFYRDVTLEKTYDQQLQQADKLASLGQLVSGIGHEINNPNQFIRGNIKIIKQSFEDLLPIIDAYAADHSELKIARLKYDFFREHIMTLVDDMEHGSERIRDIVKGLKSFARKDEGLLIDSVDINTLIEDTTRLVHNEVHKHADIVLDLAESLPVFTGNAQKIEQILVNLIVNAGQAMRDDVRGTITVRSRQDGRDLVVEVADNGIGMNENTLKQIFDPFFTTKRAKGGTGLGLAIAYRIIEEHGGTIAVTSKVGVGSTFTIRIPVKGSARQPQREKQ